MSPLCFKAALFTLGRDVHVTCSLRFTSGVTPADLLAASMAVELISSTHPSPGINSAQKGDLSHHRQTERFRLGFEYGFYFNVVDSCDKEQPFESYKRSISIDKRSNCSF